MVISLPSYENVEKLNIWYILTRPSIQYTYTVMPQFVIFLLSWYYKSLSECNQHDYSCDIVIRIIIIIIII